MDGGGEFRLDAPQTVEKPCVGGASRLYRDGIVVGRAQVKHNRSDFRHKEGLRMSFL
jgi:hypothetical protein